MITKLTSANAELYYAPRFAQITEAFKAAGKSIEIHSLEDYFLHLTDIAELEVGAKEMPQAFLLVLPADEEIFEIDANTRAITVPAFVKKNGIGVYGDHRAEMIVMTIDRYFDHEDFLNDKIVINWNFTPAGAKLPMYEENKAAAAFAPNEELNPGLVTFGFIITKDMTPGKGVLNFSVTIYDEKSGEIVYSFNTLTASVNINDTLTLTDPSIVKNDTDNYVGRLVNSVYVDNTITPVGKPEWKSGAVDEEGKFLGLDNVAYFSSIEDLNNVYEDGAMLSAYAVADPNTAEMFYKWTFNPVDGTVETAREYETVNRAADFIDVELPDEDIGEVYYVRNALGVVDYLNPLSLADAQARKQEAEENEEVITFAVRGSSFQALSAGIYQVFAQARISAGKNYEKFIGTADQLIVNKLYYLKDDQDQIIEAAPVSNEDAVAALEDGKELFVLVSAARNSDVVDSNELEIPAAKQPSVVLSMASEYQFSDSVAKDPDYTGTDYVYIDSDQIPVIVATVSIDSEDARDKAGAFAAQLIKSDAEPLTVAKIQEGIEDESLVFTALPADGKFTFQPEDIEEGEYMVRAINRRNATYSVSEPSQMINTSFVAPEVTELTVSGAMWDMNVDERPVSGFQDVLVNGEQPNDTLVNLEISRSHPRYTFDIVDNTIIDDAKYRVADIAISYFVEEVEYDSTTGEVTARIPDDNGNDPATNRPYEYYGDPDLREVIADGEGKLSFDINDDPGYYRIKVVSRYHGTIHTAYTKVFGVVSH